MPASFTTASNNASIFSDSSLNDVILRSTLLDKNVLIGTGINNKSKLAVTSNGIGIGTILPLESLDVRGNMRLSQNQYIYGNVGIGTNITDDNRMYIIGDTYTTGTIRSSNVFVEGDLIVMGSQSVINTEVKITDQFVVSNFGFDTAVMIKQVDNQNAIEIYNADRLSFIVADQGNVGINTNAPKDRFHVLGDSILSGNLTVDCNASLTGNLYCNSNTNVAGKFTSDSINNILLKYDVPDVNIINYSENLLNINIVLDNIIQDNDGFGNLIPNIDSIYISYSNDILGSNTVKTSNSVKNIKYINIYSGIEESYYSTSDSLLDTFNMYGIVTNSNYKISLYYENSRGKSVNDTVIENVSTILIGTPSTVLNLNAIILNSNININFNKPLYSDSLNNLNSSSIKDYKLIYESIDSIRYKLTNEINTKYSTSNNFIIENFDSELYIGTIYKLSVYPKNISVNEYGSGAYTYIYTGFDSNNFETGNSLNEISIINENTISHYNYNTYYAIDDGSNNINKNFISNNSTSNLLMSELKSFYQETLTSNLRLYYNPNPESNIVGSIKTVLSVTSNATEIIDTVTLNIKSFSSNNENIISNDSNIGLQLTSINTDNSISGIGDDILSNYFLKSKLKIIMNYNSNVNGNKIKYGYNRYSLNTSVNLNKFAAWELLNSSNISFNTTLSNDKHNGGSIEHNYYYDNIASIGNPSLSNFGYTLSNISEVFVSGIPTGSNYNLDYAITLNNVASYWAVNPLISLYSVDSNNSSIFSNTITTGNKYYQPTNGNNTYDKNSHASTKNYVTEINKISLTDGLSSYNYKLLFKEIQNLTLTSNNLISNINITAIGNNPLSNCINNYSIGPIHFDSNSINHSHIYIQDSNNIYGMRKYIDNSTIYSYPSVNNIINYDNKSNISTGNYSKEAILYNGYYYGENTKIWKQNWYNINTLSYNYTNIGNNNTRWSLLKYSSINGSSTDLTLNIVENSHDDKIILVKYELIDISFESVWFSTSNGYNGKSLINDRYNGDSIKNTSKIDTINKKNIKCIGVENLTMYLAVGIPNTNVDSKFRNIYIT